MTSLLEAALQYAGRGWPVIPLHTPLFNLTDAQGRSLGAPVCSCGKDCGPNVGKHPRVRQTDGKWGSIDPKQIEKWWRRWPKANVGLATGRGLIVIDVDGPDDAAALAEIQADQGERFPESLVASSGRGPHLYFAGKLDGSRMAPMLVRGAGSYVVAPPSLHRNRNHYQWISSNKLNELPNWFHTYLETFDTEGKRELNSQLTEKLGPRPAFLVPKEGVARLVQRIAKADRLEWSIENETLILSALAAIPASIQRLPWLKVGMALFSIDWIIEQGESWAHRQFHLWSAQCSEKYTEHLTDVAWNSFGRRDRARTIGIGSLFHMAKSYGWRMPAEGGVEPNRVPTMPLKQESEVMLFAGNIPVKQSESQPPGGFSFPGAAVANGHHTAPALAAAVWAGPQPIAFTDVDDDGRPKATCTNAAQAITGLGISCQKDTFHEKMLVGGHLINQWAGDLSDEAVQVLRRLTKRTYGFDPGERNARDAAVQLCLERPFNPVTDYLGALAWDGQERVCRWVVDYLGSPDNPLNREIGKLMLLAAVRRARRPGCKFDQIVVLEGPEGTGKSSALEILAGTDNFSDQTILGKSDRDIQEAIQGIWLYEIADLVGMKRAEVEHVKAFASRTVDRARPAYGRFRVDAPRKGIFVATTNTDTYLKSDTGDRRFWPLPTSRIDIEAVRRDRDQLWAEAAVLETRAVTIALDVRLWVDAAEVQASRLEGDPWDQDVLAFMDKKKHNATIRDILVDGLLISPSELSRAHQMRASGILKRHLYKRVKTWQADGTREWRYRL